MCSAFICVCFGPKAEVKILHFDPPERGHSSAPMDCPLAGRHLLHLSGPRRPSIIEKEKQISVPRRNFNRERTVCKAASDERLEIFVNYG